MKSYFDTQYGRPENNKQANVLRTALDKRKLDKPTARQEAKSGGRSEEMRQDFKNDDDRRRPPEGGYGKKAECGVCCGDSVGSDARRPLDDRAVRRRLGGRARGPP